MQPLPYPDTINDRALAELYHLHAQELLTHLRVNTQSREDAEDLLLDVFVAALEHTSFHRLPLEKQRLWLWRVARNKLVDYYRKRSLRQHLPLDHANETSYRDGELVPEWAVLRNEEQRSLRAAIEDLPPLQKELLLLRFVNGLRSPEIARLLGKRDSAVRMMLSRTLNRLRETFEKRQG